MQGLSMTLGLLAADRRSNRLSVVRVESRQIQRQDWSRAADQVVPAALQQVAA
jgi:hypothetical protein